MIKPSFFSSISRNCIFLIKFILHEPSYYTLYLHVLQPDDSETYKILQISDIHYDPLYQPGKNAKCNEPLCCQADHPDPTDVEAECGYWLDYNAADTPWHTIVDVVRQVNTQVLPKKIQIR